MYLGFARNVKAPGAASSILANEDTTAAESPSTVPPVIEANSCADISIFTVQNGIVAPNNLYMCHNTNSIINYCGANIVIFYQCTR